MTAAAFVDTAYLVAMLDPRDRLNGEATNLAKKLSARRAMLTTSDAVFVEFANYFSKSPLRTRVIDWIEAMRTADGWDVVAVDRALQTRAEGRYRAHEDKNWSLTDCISMEVMTARGIRDIATTDGGFAQAGFRVLMT